MRKDPASTMLRVKHMISLLYKNKIRNATIVWLVNQYTHITTK